MCILALLQTSAAADQKSFVTPSCPILECQSNLGRDGRTVLRRSVSAHSIVLDKLIGLAFWLSTSEKLDLLTASSHNPSPRIICSRWIFEGRATTDRLYFMKPRPQQLTHNNSQHILFPSTQPDSIKNRMQTKS
jgi:hypothetical protein